MFSKLYAATFVIVIVLGILYQRDYMTVSAAEAMILEERMRRNTELAQTSSFVFERYAGTRHRDRVEGTRGLMMTDGSLRLSGNLWVAQSDDKGSNTVRIHTELATGQVTMPMAAGGPKLAPALAPRNGPPSNLQALQFPNEVRVYLSDGVLLTSNVTLSFLAQVAQTQQPVEFRGTGQTLNGRGLLFRMDEGTFELGGPVTGRVEPARSRLLQQEIQR
jgi:hypothetical protein